MVLGENFKRAQTFLNEKIDTEGSNQNREMILVDRFLNQGLDIHLIEHIGRAFAEVFSDRQVDKVLTSEASGIALAFATAQAMKINAIFAKKGRPHNLSADILEVKVHSYTRQNVYSLSLSKNLIQAGDRILLVDDFLARGQAMQGLMSLVQQAGAEVVGVAVAIEKSFQGGSALIRDAGYEVVSLVDYD